MYSEHLSTITSLRYINDNWDGYGGKKPSNLAIVDAVTLLSEVYKFGTVSRVGLSGDGEIGLFIDEDDFFMDLGVYGDGTFSYYIKTKRNKLHGDNLKIEDGLPYEVKSFLYSRIALNFTRKLVDNQVESPKEVHGIITENFWDLL